LWWIRPQSGRHAIRIESHILQGPSSRLMACMYLGVYQKKSLKSLSLSHYFFAPCIIQHLTSVCVCVCVWIASFFLLIFSPTLFFFFFFFFYCRSFFLFPSLFDEFKKAMSSASGDRTKWREFSSSSSTFLFPSYFSFLFFLCVCFLISVLFRLSNSAIANSVSPPFVSDVKKPLTRLLMASLSLAQLKKKKKKRDEDSCHQRRQ
jgi:hypothetical protein